MQHHTLTVMAVDDDAINLEILLKNLKDAGYESMGFEDGDVAWEYLTEHPEEVDIVLLDKMMPRMNGMQVLGHMKGHANLRNIPVILQTGDIGVEQTREGLAAGAYYYLEKPFDPAVMISLINAAARDCTQKSEVLQEVKQEKSITHMLQEGTFYLQTTTEANRLSGAIAHHAQHPEEIGIALSELMVNAVEHGNLAIGYEEKASLLASNKWESEIQRRLHMPENKKKKVTVHFKRTVDRLTITISDEGKGFNWQSYLEFDPLRLTDPNGRGIAAARLICPDINYRDKGNVVVCSFNLAKEGQVADKKQARG